MEILYEDPTLVVAVKPSGVLSEWHASAPSMPARLQGELGCEILPVHRLDRETAGVMVYAKEKNAAARLSAAFSAHETEKLYFAVTRTALPEEAGEMRDLLFRDKARSKSYVVDRKRKGVREAVLHYRRIGEKEGLFLYAVTLETGRTHQIRVQFASRGCPLVGDRRYGGDPSFPFSLFAARLSFPHPKNGEKCVFAALPPETTVFAAFLPELSKSPLQSLENMLK